MSLTTSYRSISITGRITRASWRLLAHHWFSSSDIFSNLMSHTKACLLHFTEVLASCLLFHRPLALTTQPSSSEVSSTHTAMNSRSFNQLFCSKPQRNSLRFFFHSPLSVLLSQQPVQARLAHNLMTIICTAQLNILAARLALPQKLGLCCPWLCCYTLVKSVRQKRSCIPHESKQTNQISLWKKSEA